MRRIYSDARDLSFEQQTRWSIHHCVVQLCKIGPVQPIHTQPVCSVASEFHTILSASWILVHLESTLSIIPRTRPLPMTSTKWPTCAPFSWCCRPRKIYRFLLDTPASCHSHQIVPVTVCTTNTLRDRRYSMNHSFVALFYFVSLTCDLQSSFSIRWVDLFTFSSTEFDVLFLFSFRHRPLFQCPLSLHRLLLHVWENKTLNE